MSLQRHQVPNENARSSCSNKEIADYMTGDQTIRLTLNSMQLFSRFERSANRCEIAYMLILNSCCNT